MAEVLMAIEENRLRNERLLEQLVQQGARWNNDCNNLNEFLRSQPPLSLLLKSPWMLMIGCVLLSAISLHCMFQLLNK